ncbi:MAG: hypothetical protein IKT67_12930 [Lachnospiraceae bacterium]|nr:hypothetical protein [Lachnospiraceae bacterium]
MKLIIEVILIIVFAIYWFQSTKLDRRLVKVGKALAEQNALLEKRCELLETIFAKQYEEVKKKYASDRKEQP